MMACERYENEHDSPFPPPDLSAHVSGCSECQQNEERHLRLVKLVRVAGTTAEPTPGWRPRLDARLNHATPIPLRPPAARFPMRGTLLAAAALMAGLLGWGLTSFPHPAPGGPPGGPESSGQDVVTRIEQPTGMRSNTPVVGSRYLLEVPRNTEVRLWLNGKTLIARCPQGPGCEVDGDHVKLHRELANAGEYQVMIVNQKPGVTLPEPKGFDDDAKLMREHAVGYQVLEPFQVY